MFPSVLADPYAWLLALILLALQVADVLTTNKALDLGHVEANPIMARVQDALGRAWPIPKLVVVTCVTAILLWIGGLVAVVSLAGLCLVYLFVVASNFAVIQGRRR